MNLTPYIKNEFYAISNRLTNLLRYIVDTYENNRNLIKNLT
jgi:hypothetical protein